MEELNDKGKTKLLMCSRKEAIFLHPELLADSHKGDNRKTLIKTSPKGPSRAPN